METYATWAPTGFDSKGLNLEDRQDWLVVPVILTRDSDILEESNFAAATKTLQETGPEGEDWENHRFGHWGCGWLEILIVRPETKAAEMAEEMEAALSDYPVLDDDDYSRREWEATYEAWERSTVAERVRLLQEAGRESIFAARRDEFPQDDSGYISERLLGN